MLTLLRTRLVWVWLALVGATALSFVMGHGIGISNHRVAGIAILVIAFVKVHFVMFDFMELRHAPRFLRAFAEVWLVVVCAMLATVYWYGPSSSSLLVIAQEVIDGLR